MKRAYFILYIFLTATSTIAQPPQKLNYQAVIRNVGNNPVVNSEVGMRISILQGSVVGTVSYTETQTPITNSTGMVNIEIGAGTVVTGAFASIDWTNDPFFIKTETDPIGGTNYNITSVSKILSVPYTINAKSAESVINLVSPVNPQDVATKEYVDVIAVQLNGLEDNLIASGTFNLTDIDGNEYKVVRIGTQIWMAENLKTTRFNDGTSIPLVTDPTSWSNLTTPGYSWYDNTTSFKQIYVVLYNWYTVDATSNGSKNVCPTGWHVPTDAEWTTMESYLIINGNNYDGTTIGNKIAKSLASATGWNASATAGAVGNTDYPTFRNKTGFTALPGGYRSANGQFGEIGNNGWWWSATAFDASNAVVRSINNGGSSFGNYSDLKKKGENVRCLKD